MNSVFCFSWDCATCSQQAFNIVDFRLHMALLAILTLYWPVPIFLYICFVFIYFLFHLHFFLCPLLAILTHFLLLPSPYSFTCSFKSFGFPPVLSFPESVSKPVSWCNMFFDFLVHTTTSILTEQLVFSLNLNSQNIGQIQLQNSGGCWKKTCLAVHPFF